MSDEKEVVEAAVESSEEKAAPCSTGKKEDRQKESRKKESC